MTDINKLEPVNYSASDAELFDACVDRDIDPPYDPSGKFVRKLAVKRLTEWENKYAKKREDLWEVIFHKSDNPSANDKYFQLLHNGDERIGPYEKPVILPERFLSGCADTAVQTLHIPDPQNINNITTTKSHTFPYTRIRKIEPEEKVTNLAATSELEFIQSQQKEQDAA